MNSSHSDQGTMEEVYRINRLNWDERVDSHFNSAMYQRHLRDLERGSVCLAPEHVRRMGDVTGKKLIHLQCHMGMETLSWARLGAEVTGIDFSQPAIDRATQISSSLGLKGRFICANVYETPRLVPQQFDIVFVSVGSICWLPDIASWAEIVADLLKRNGKLYMDEVHPFADVLDDDPTESMLIVRHPYFHTEGQLFDEGGSYTDRDAVFEHNKAVCWTHSLGVVINALIAHGLNIRALHESERCEWPRFKQMREVAPNLFDLPGSLAGKLPMTYTLIAEKA